MCLFKRFELKPANISSDFSFSNPLNSVTTRLISSETAKLLSLTSFVLPGSETNRDFNDLYLQWSEKACNRRCLTSTWWMTGPSAQEHQQKLRDPSVFQTKPHSCTGQAHHLPRGPDIFSKKIEHFICGELKKFLTHYQTNIRLTP